MELVVIAHGFADISDGQMRQFQKFCGLGHAVIQQEILRSASYGIFEDLSKITPVQAAVICDVFHGNIILKVLFNESQGLMYVEITEFSRLGCDQAYRSHGTRQEIQKEVCMSYEMERSHIAVLRDIEHFLHHGLPHIPGMGMVDRAVRSEPGDGNGFSDAQSVKFDPDIFPGEVFVSDIHIDLLGKDHESLSAFNLVSLCDSFGIICFQNACSGYDIMEQIVETCCWPEAVGWRAPLPSKLVKI